MKGKLTKRTVEAIRPAARDVLVWDTELPGFGIKVTPKGSRVYVLQYRFRGRAKRYTIGRHGIDVTADEARTEATRLRGLIADRKNPSGDRALQRLAPTVKELAERYMTEHATPHKKASSSSTDRRNIDNHVIPLLGRLRVPDVEPADITRAVREIADGKTRRDEKTGKRRGRRIVAGGPGVANRVLALLSKMFNLAEIWRLRPPGSNPCRHAEKFAERKVERFLSAEELGRLGDALANAEAAKTDLSALAAIRLLLFTGCRLSEILGLRWAWVDTERRLLLLPDSKTGAKSVFLSSPALQVLRTLKPAPDNPYVLPGKRRGEALQSIRGPWARVQRAAHLEGVRLHDLRHSFASVGVAGGLSLPVIGTLLGHAQPNTTARYAHLGPSPLHEAADAIGVQLEAAMSKSSTQKAELKG